MLILKTDTLIFNGQLVIILFRGKGGMHLTAINNVILLMCALYDSRLQTDYYMDSIHNNGRA